VSEAGTTATWSGSGTGEQLWFLGTLATIKIPGEASNGRFALIEFLFPRHASPPLHTHPQDESYIVQEGLLTVQAGEQRFQLAPGAAAWFRWESRTLFAWIATPRECLYSARRRGSNAWYEMVRFRR